MKKMRVWWIPQVPMKAFYVPVSSPEEAKKVMDILAVYDAFQFENNVKPDYCNVGGLQMWDEEEQDWIDWYLEIDNDCFESVDDYCDSEECENKEELEKFRKEIYDQVNWEKIY